MPPSSPLPRAPSLGQKKLQAQKEFYTKNARTKGRAIFLALIDDSTLKIFLQNAAETLGIIILFEVDTTPLLVFDGVISDRDIIEPALLQALFEAGVAPILSKNVHWNPRLSEFNPMKFSGNAFLFEEKNPLLIFEKICRFLENNRYAGDRKNLLTNIADLPLH